MPTTHYLEDGTHMIDITQATPVQVIVGFTQELNVEQSERAVLAATYWAGSPPLSGSQPTVHFSGMRDIMLVSANFENGYFDGDLTHHNAIGVGDDEFEIGLLNLLVNGRSPATKRGTMIMPVTLANVAYIQMVYDNREPITPKPDHSDHIDVKDLRDRVIEIEGTLATIRNIL